MQNVTGQRIYAPSAAIPHPSVTFATAAAGQKLVSDDLIWRMLTNTLEISPGVKSPLIKGYLDSVPVGDSDRAFCFNTQALADYHDQLSSFIARRLTFYTTGLDEAARVVIKQAKDSFIAGLPQANRRVRSFYREWRSWDGNQSTRPASRILDIDFHGCEITTTSGTHDLLDHPWFNVRPTIQLQRNPAGLFVQWNSQRYLKQSLGGRRPDLSSRIYLNPTIEETIGVFEQVIAIAETYGLAIKGKVLDRSIECLGRIGDPNPVDRLRGDAIVLYASKDEADQLLGIVEDVYKRNHRAFKGRRTSPIPKIIGDGVAIGEQPVGAESLSSSCADLFEASVKETQKRMGIMTFERLDAQGQQTAITTFRRAFLDECKTRNINPDNIAFNASPNLEQHTVGI